MYDSESVRKRMASLDGATFRFERKAHNLFVNDMPVQVHARDHGVVELVTEHKTVQVSGATYWEMVYDDLVPTRLFAGMILAKYDQLAGRLRHIATERSQGQENAFEEPGLQG